MPPEKLINNQYLIEETLHYDAFQRIYLASDQFTEAKTPVYITVFKDMDAGSPITNAFFEYEKELKALFADFFLIDDVLYTVSRCCPGKPLANFITNTYLNTYEKGMIVSSYLNKINALEPLPLMLKYVLCSFGNISIVDRKMVCFNHIPFFSPQDLIVTHKEYMERIGDFILTIYGNSTNAELTPAIYEMEPAVDAIIRHCYHGHYETVEDIQNDFNPVFFRARMSQEETRQPKPKPFIPADEAPLVMPDHPDAPKRSFIYTREKKEGRKSRKARKVRRLAISSALLLVVFFIGVFGISRFINRGPADEDLMTEVELPVESQEEADPLSPEDIDDDFTDSEATDSVPPEAENVPEISPPEEVQESEPPLPDQEDPPSQYTVRSGDTLYSISQRVYGDGGRYPEIMEANNITDPSSLRAGQVLQIP